jgi:pyruvate/2-oxoglutarate dehydrogenase complex dihydrolipoamide acyltransferase (E2) component
MARVDVLLPQLGDSVEGCLVTAWLKQVGDPIAEQEPLLEVTTDKVTIEIPSEHAGHIVELCVKPGDSVQVGAVICRIE